MDPNEGTKGGEADGVQEGQEHRVKSRTELRAELMGETDLRKANAQLDRLTTMDELLKHHQAPEIFLAQLLNYRDDVKRALAKGNSSEVNSGVDGMSAIAAYFDRKNQTHEQWGYAILVAALLAAGVSAWAFDEVSERAERKGAFCGQMSAGGELTALNTVDPGLMRYIFNSKTPQGILDECRAETGLVIDSDMAKQAILQTLINGHIPMADHKFLFDLLKGWDSVDGQKEEQK